MKGIDPGMLGHPKIISRALFFAQVPPKKHFHIGDFLGRGAANGRPHGLQAIARPKSHFDLPKWKLRWLPELPRRAKDSERRS